MDRLSRFDVAEYAGVKMVVLESDLLPPDPAVVVIPLLADYPAVKDLNPELLHDDKARPGTHGSSNFAFKGKHEDHSSRHRLCGPVDGGAARPAPRRGGAGH